MTEFIGFNIKVPADRQAVTLAFGSPHPAATITVSPEDAAELGRRLTEAAGYCLIDEVPPGLQVEDPDPDSDH